MVQRSILRISLVQNPEVMLAKTFRVDYPIYKVLVFFISTYNESIVPVFFLVLHSVSQLTSMNKTLIRQSKDFYRFIKKSNN